jgi:hypothetical protein
MYSLGSCMSAILDENVFTNRMVLEDENAMAANALFSDITRWHDIYNMCTWTSR